MMKEIKNYVHAELDGIKYLNSYDFLMDFDETQNGCTDWEKNVEAFKAICEKHNIHYYGEVKENFSERLALKQAKDKKATYLLLDNLS